MVKISAPQNNMISVLTFTRSVEEIVAGVPKTVSIESNVPATIYFTLDGSTPTINSPIYISTISMPFGETTVVLSAFGVNADGYDGPILTQVFSADVSQVDIARNLGLEGIVVDRFDDPTNTVVGYDAGGDPVSFTDIELDEIHSSQGRLGIADGVKIELQKPNPEDTGNPFDDNFVISSNNDNGFYNPFAKVIYIDNANDNVVDTYSRPWGSMRTNHMHGNMWSAQELRSSDSNYISGGYMRTFYNKATNSMVSYFYDNNTNRWLRKRQDLPNVPNIFQSNYSGQASVFQWIGRGRHSIIPI